MLITYPPFYINKKYLYIFIEYKFIQWHCKTRPQARHDIIRLTDGSSTMKKLVLAALLSTFAFGAVGAEKISFGVSATYPPFESMDANNQIVGFDLDLAKALCKQMQAECTFTNHAFDSLIPALKFKKYDAVISGMDITPDRSKQVSFTDPYYANSALVIAKKDAFHSFADLKANVSAWKTAPPTRNTCRISILK